MITALLTPFIAFNVALIISFLTIRLGLQLPYCQQRLSHQQRLLLCKITLITTTLLFFVGFIASPLFQWLTPVSAKNPFAIQPLVQHSIDSMAYPEQMASLSPVTTTPARAIPYDKLLLVLFSGIASLFLYRYLQGYWYLRRHLQRAFCLRRLHHLRIYYSDHMSIPCCFTLFQLGYIILPSRLLLEPQTLHIALKHELQHLRQGDPKWQHLFSLLQVFSCGNPCITLWKRWLNELQELACDEAMVKQHKATEQHYAQALVSVAAFHTQHGLPTQAMGFVKTKSLLRYRIEQVLISRDKTAMTRSLLTPLTLLLACLLSINFAIAAQNSHGPLNYQQVSQIQQKNASNQQLQLLLTPETIEKINYIRQNRAARQFMQQSLVRMQTYQPLLTELLQQQQMPTELIALPLAESGFQLDGNSHTVDTLGIWNFIPDTARTFGLVVSSQRDERKDTQLASKAALNYLQSMYREFQDWNLAIAAYHIGPTRMQQLIDQSNSTDPAEILSQANPELKEYLAVVTASLIIMQNPDLI